MRVHRFTVTRLDEDRFQASCECSWLGEPLIHPPLAALVDQFDSHLGLPPGTSMAHWREAGDG